MTPPAAVPTGRFGAGALVARVLAGMWRQVPPPCDLSEEQLRQVAPLLLETGAGGLGWKRVEGTPLAHSELGRELHDAYRMHTLKGGVLEHSLHEVVQALRDEGCEPLLLKGWAAARLYPAKGLRPYGDLDIAVGPAARESALRIILEKNLVEQCVDLHGSGHRVTAKPWGQIFRASRLRRLAGIDIRIPCEEDHLRICCLHFLRHGGWRPLWLCDVAIAVENASEDFDWATCLSGGPEVASGIFCTISAARDLLGARPPTRCAELLPRRIPSWFLPTILREWSRAPIWPLELPRYRRHLTVLIRELPRRWPNKIAATARCSAAFDDRARLPLQLKDVFRRSVRALSRP